MTTITTTVNELASKLGLDYQEASAITKLMCKQGKGKEVGKRNTPGKKGKPSIIFELNDVFVMSLTGIEAIETVATPVSPVDPG